MVSQPRDLHSDAPALEGFGLMTFEEAADFLHSGVSVSALRKARREGSLWATQIGKRFYTTRHALREYLQCQGTNNRPASTSDTMNASGSFATAAPKSGQDMALSSVAKLKQLSRNTSPASRSSGGMVLPIRGN
ncbi:hypothetical protein AP071_06490 [Rhodobacter capsulatus]|nr:hypothetical protein AP071_06490 [Rhodobacter capsulatus]KQB15959.1 hypothetical protein AP073_12035 [Rhodobacter capsulatus]